MTANRMANGLVLCDKTNPPPPILRLDHRGRRHDRPCRDLRDLCRLHRSPGGDRRDRLGFVRMIKPRFKWHTGHVTVGGSMCTELLTPGGWQPMTVHALLLTVCQMLRQGEAQIQLKPDEHCMWPLKDYSEMEAREAYERVAKFHGWPTQRRHA